MPFPVRLLHEGEEIVLDVRPHWWSLMGPLSTSVIVLAGGILAVIAGVGPAASWTVAAVLLLAMLWLLCRYLRWLSTSLVVTTERLIRRQGVLSRRSKEIPLDHLNDISYHQSLFDRIVGAGDVVLESAGREGQELFADLPHPAAIQREISRQITGGRARRDRPPGPAERSIPEQIGELDQLRRQGVITQAEFDLAKAQLLDRM